MDFPIEAVGVNGQIKMYDARIDITRKGARGFLYHGFDGTKTIFIRKMTAIQYKEAGLLTNGFIQFIFEGSIEDKGGLWGATRDENTILFTKEQQPQFEKIRDFIFMRLDF